MFLNYNVSPYFYIKIPRTPITLCRAYGIDFVFCCFHQTFSTELWISWIPRSHWVLMLNTT